MKKLLVVLLIAWLGAGATATYLWRQLDALRSQNIALQAQVTALEIRVPVTAAISPQVLRTETSAPPAVPAPSSAVEHAAPNLADKDFRRSMMRATLPQQYPDLDKVLGLTSDELDKFEDLLVRQFTSRTLGRTPAEQAEVAGLLGDKYPQWQAYQESLPARLQVSLLRSQLAASGSTLSEEQAEPLMAALNAELKLIGQDSRKPRPPLTTAQETRDRDLQGAAEASGRLVKTATPYLNAQQLDSYRRMLDQALQMQRLTMDVMSNAQSQTGTHN